MHMYTYLRGVVWAELVTSFLAMFYIVCMDYVLDYSNLTFLHLHMALVHVHVPHHLQTCVDQAVYSFGHMLYEMGSAQMCKTATIDTCPSPIPAGVGESLSFTCALP